MAQVKFTVCSWQQYQSVEKDDWMFYYVTDNPSSPDQSTSHGLFLGDKFIGPTTFQDVVTYLQQYAIENPNSVLSGDSYLGTHETMFKDMFAVNVTASGKNIADTGNGAMGSLVNLKGVLVGDDGLPVGTGLYDGPIYPFYATEYSTLDKNLFNESRTVNGYTVSSGHIVSGAGENDTLVYFPVKAGTRYSLVFPNQQLYGVYYSREYPAPVNGSLPTSPTLSEITSEAYGSDTVYIPENDGFMVVASASQVTYQMSSRSGYYSAYCANVEVGCHVYNGHGEASSTGYINTDHTALPSMPNRWGMGGFVSAGSETCDEIDFSNNMSIIRTGRMTGSEISNSIVEVTAGSKYELTVSDIASDGKYVLRSVSGMSNCTVEGKKITINCTSQPNFNNTVLYYQLENPIRIANAQSTTVRTRYWNKGETWFTNRRDVTVGGTVYYIDDIATGKAIVEETIPQYGKDYLLDCVENFNDLIENGFVSVTVEHIDAGSVNVSGDVIISGNLNLLQWIDID